MGMPAQSTMEIEPQVQGESAAAAQPGQFKGMSWKISPWIWRRGDESSRLH
jgi:hypothetical protein